MDQKYFVAMIIEYIRTLIHYQIDVLYFIYEMVINCLVRNNHYYQLHQFLQYHVIADSSPVACQLLSIENRYPPAGQLALDMLKRLNTKPEHIVEILLLRKQVLPALRMLKKTKREPKLSEIAEFLDVAKLSDDDILFYTVFKYFDDRGCIKKYSDPLNEYISLYKKKFDIN